MFIGDLIGEVCRKRLRQYLDWDPLPPHKIFWNPEENDPIYITGLIVIKLFFFSFNMKTYYGIGKKYKNYFLPT